MDVQRAKSHTWSWEGAGAVCCFSAGMVAGLFGIVVTGIAWILGTQRHPGLHGVGTALLVVTIPLLILSGYCLDWEEHRSKNKGSGEIHHAGRQ